MIVAIHRWYDRISGSTMLVTSIKDSAVANAIIHNLISKYPHANNYIVYSKHYKQYKSKYKIRSSLANEIINTCKHNVLREGQNTLIATGNII